MQKKNNKLESFLFKTLPEQNYERIRGYESCIVVSEKENKAFKYVVLGDEWVYLTENPPKSIHREVPLADVISVELVNDFPDFLVGESRKDCQHIEITYWTSEPVKRRSFRKKKSPRGSLSDLHGDRSNTSTPLSMASSYDTWGDEMAHNSSITSLPVRPDSRGSVSSARETRKASLQKKKKKGSQSLRTIQSESEDTILKALKEEDYEDDILEDIENQSELGDSMAKSHNNFESNRTARSLKSARSNTSRSLRPLPSPGPKQKAFENPVMEKSTPSIIDTNELPKKKGLTPEPSPTDNDEPSSCCLRCCSFSFGKTRVSPFCGTGKSPPPSDKNKLFSASTDNTNSHSQSVVSIQISGANPEIVTDRPTYRRGSSINSSVSTLRGLNERSGTPANEDAERRSVLSMASLSDYGGSVQRLSLLSVEGILEKRRAVLHLYLLSSLSPMLMLIRSAWCNCLLSSTLMLNPEVPETPKGSIMKGSQRGKQEILFQELKRDLLKDQLDMEDLFYLLNELKLATERNYVLKRFFWKDTDLLKFFVSQLQNYLPKSLAKADPAMRVNEFELITLLIDILHMMFHESEIIQERTQALKTDRGKTVLALLMVLTCNPDVPDKRGDKMDSEKILKQFLKTSLGTVFELFLMAKQANWGHLEGSFYNISWMISTLEELRDTEKFVARLVDLLLEMISKSSGDKLLPPDSVLLYQMFFVLDNFLEYSRRLKSFLATTYTEEFKYFVQVHLVMRKVPQTYPLYHMLVGIVEEVVKKVLPSPQTAKQAKI
ncbi:uncharacterized protein C12orf56-like [Dreissena polymorpha]|uniref:Uncharacterized protein n=1 Tax=Dreissena polymorpha TaxID=45954 RepID=A0A9D4NEG8_DREPO|nr:uncharacterized protein C12orf56-like [Dreissena polymorpha]KAH3892254.1 hypothetical protein DPMN_016369 [Dreissena polymorpha]